MARRPPQPASAAMSSGPRPSACTVLLRLAWPEVIVILDLAICSLSARNPTSDLLAAPSTGGAVSFMRRTPSETPTTSFRDERGRTLTEKVTPVGVREMSSMCCLPYPFVAEIGGVEAFKPRSGNVAAATAFPWTTLPHSPSKENRLFARRDG